MHIFDFLSDKNFGLASFTLLGYWTINYNYKIDHFTISDIDRSNWLETIPIIIILSLFIVVCCLP